jgi:carboxypeptidase Q
MRPAALLLALATTAACSNAPAPAPSSESSSQPPAATVASPAAPAPSASLPPGPRTPADDFREAVLHDSRAFATVRSLTDECGPRLSGSPGNKTAIAWGLRAMEAAGLAAVHAESASVPHWERGVETAEIVAPVSQRLVLAALGGSVGTPPAGLEGEVVEAASLEALDKMARAEVAGKIVFFYVKTDRTRDGSGYGRAVPARGSGASHAAKLGAVATVIRSIGTDDNRLPHTGAMRYDDGVDKIPAAALSVPDAELLHRLLEAGKPVRLHLTLGCRTLPDADGANVVGDVKGSEAPDEIVLLGAHLDSWDLGTGAIDDGAGIGIVLEAGRQIALLPKKPRRTVRVVFYANEENGLAGGKAYAKAHEAELDKHVLAMEADLGAGKVYGAAFLGPPEAQPAFLAIARTVAPLGVEVLDREVEGGADISTLRPAGVPFIDLRQDATTYFDLHHTANDTLDKIDPEDLKQAAAAVATVAFAAASSAESLGRVPADKRAGKR